MHINQLNDRQHEQQAVVHAGVDLSCHDCHAAALDTHQPQERFTDLLAPRDSESALKPLSSPFSQNTSPFKQPVACSSSSAAQQRKYSWAKVTVTSAAQLKSLVQHTLRKRHTASTAINDKSSRSHVIVTITVEQRRQVFETGDAGLEPAAASDEGSRRVSSSNSSTAAETVDTDLPADCGSSECDSISVCGASPVTTYLIG